MIRFLRVSFLLAFVGIAYARSSSGTPFALPRSPLNKALQVRGGACLDPTAVAQVVTGAALVQGAAFTVAPDQSLDMYGIPKTPLASHILVNCGNAVLAFGILGYCLLFKDMSLAKATGWTTLLWVIELLRGLLTGSSKDAGLSDEGQYFVLTLFTLLSWALLGGASGDYADLAMSVNKWWLWINGAAMYLDPSRMCNFWGAKDSDDSGNYLMRSFGCFLLGLGTLANAAATKDAAQAVGYGWVCMLFHMLSTNFITKEIVKLDCPTVPQYLWTVFDALVVAALLTSNQAVNDAQG